jgi:hypothetical protein
MQLIICVTKLIFYIKKKFTNKMKGIVHRINTMSSVNACIKFRFCVPIAFFNPIISIFSKIKKTIVGLKFSV